VQPGDQPARVVPGYGRQGTLGPGRQVGLSLGHRLRLLLDLGAGIREGLQVLVDDVHVGQLRGGQAGDLARGPAGIAHQGSDPLQRSPTGVGVERTGRRLLTGDCRGPLHDLHLVTGPPDRVPDLSRLGGGLRRQSLDLLSDDGEAAAVLTGPGGLDGRVQRQQLGLVGDAVDDRREISDAGQLVACQRLDQLMYAGGVLTDLAGRSSRPGVMGCVSSSTSCISPVHRPRRCRVEG
jgi:hypothetical protein